MPIINSPKVSDTGNPSEKLQKILDIISKNKADVMFIDENEKPVLTISYIEQVIGEYAQITQNPQISNKWISTDSKLLEALAKFKNELRILLAGQLQMGSAQQALQSAAPEAPIPTQSPQGQSHTQAAMASQQVDRSLPTEQK